MGKSFRGEYGNKYKRDKKQEYKKMLRKNKDLRNDSENNDKKLNIPLDNHNYH